MLILRPAGTSRLCFSGSFPKKSARATTPACGPKTARDFLRLPSQKAPLATWEQGALACFATGVPSEFRTNQIRRINTMALYENTIRLKGFLGRDAEIKQTSNNPLIILSLATKSSYKDK
ncbi:MAG: hypothetical protein ACRDRL_03695 [Sciscionella sp.]